MKKDMEKYKQALKNLSFNVYRLCKEHGWKMDSKDIETIKELIDIAIVPKFKQEQEMEISIERFTKYNPMLREYQLIDEPQTSFEAKQRLGIIENLMEENNIKNVDELKLKFQEIQFEKEETQRWYDLLGEIDIKDHKIAVLERALELACEKLAEIEMIDVVIQNGYVSGEPKDIGNYFKSQAERDIKNEKE